MNNWCTIESDPAVFEEMISKMGAPGVAVQEVFSLDYSPEVFDSIGPVYGFIFLFKWTQAQHKKTRPFFGSPEVFFAKQVIENACATQAILCVLLNNADKIKLEGELAMLEDFSKGLDPYSRGLTIGECNGIREIHNSFAKQDSFQYIGGKSKEKEDAYHFVGYVHKEGHVLELDGLKEGPVDLGAAGAHDWIPLVLDELRSRVQSYAEQEIRFTLLAITDNKLAASQKQLAEVEARLAGLAAEAAAKSVALPLKIDAKPDEQTKKLGDEFERLSHVKADLIDWLHDFDRRKQKQKEENERRKHNFVPLIFALLEASAKSGQLLSLYDAACEKMADKNKK